MTDIVSGKTVVYFAETSALSDPVCHEKAYRAVSDMRREKADGYRFEKDRLLSLGAGVLMKYGLAVAGLSEPFPEVCFGPQGKPYLKNHPEIFFNLSHAGTHVIAAFSDTETGCDVELLSHAALKIAEHFFTPEEQADIASKASENEKNECFIRYWTLKESYLKMTGEGLSLPLSGFSVTLSEPVSACRDGRHADCFFSEYDGFPDARAAVCTRDNTEVFWIPVNLYEITEKIL